MQEMLAILEKCAAEWPHGLYLDWDRFHFPSKVERPAQEYDLHQPLN